MRKIRHRSVPLRPTLIAFLISLAACAIAPARKVARTAEKAVYERVTIPALIGSALAVRSLVQRAIWLLALTLFGLTACAQKNPDGYQPNANELALTDSIYQGEWKSGYLYEITFTGVGAEMTALVRVIDSDDAATEFRMPARVVVQEKNVTLNFTKFDRVDHLVFDPDAKRLSGYSVHKGRKRKKDLWAEKV